MPVRARARRLRDLGRRRQPVRSQVQYAYSAAIRWGDFEGAWTLVDPEYRKAHPLSDVEMERYKQVQIAGYRDLATQTLPDGDVVREIEIEVVNRHTLAQRRRATPSAGTSIRSPSSGGWWSACRISGRTERRFCVRGRARATIAARSPTPDRQPCELRRTAGFRRPPHPLLSLALVGITLALVYTEIARLFRRLQGPAPGRS